jgi:hypothetical protein
MAMVKFYAASVAAAFGFATLFLGAAEAAAKPGGGWAKAPSHSFHSSPGKRPLAHHRRAFRGWPWVGGYLGYPPYSYYGFDSIGDAALVRFASPPEPPRVLSCQRSRETVTVSSPDGGSREIKITRC